ncbi:hypothetical protein SDC9_135159 [bioreactor metagenome]|uniref:Uncharacterized protein n=1 Tax=bioreactor metagenome TaxID=1076179 RepID=A0A645DG91_9ZZZZ
MYNTEMTIIENIKVHNIISFGNLKYANTVFIIGYNTRRNIKLNTTDFNIICLSLEVSIEKEKFLIVMNMYPGTKYSNNTGIIFITSFMFKTSPMPTYSFQDFVVLV